MISLTPVVNNDENEKLALALQKEKDRHRLYKRRYLSNLSRLGLMMETVIDVQGSFNGLVFLSQDVRESDRSLVYFIKVHLPWSLMLKYAEELNFRVPIRVILIWISFAKNLLSLGDQQLQFDDHVRRSCSSLSPSSS